MLDALLRFAEWLLEVLLWIPRKLWELFLDALASFFEWLPVPEFFANAGIYLDAIPGPVLYFASLLALPYGLTVVLGASVIRFVIRRLPVVG